MSEISFSINLSLNDVLKIINLNFNHFYLLIFGFVDVCFISFFQSKLIKFLNCELIKHNPKLRSQQAIFLTENT